MSIPQVTESNFSNYKQGSEVFLYSPASWSHGHLGAEFQVAIVNISKVVSMP